MHNSPNRLVIAAIIYKDGKILIAKRNKDDELLGMWEFPGGKLEEPETQQECLARELLEEFGITAQVGNYMMSSFFSYKDRSYEMRMYLVTQFTGAIQLGDHSEIKWVSIDDLDNYQYQMPEPDRPVVKFLVSISTLFNLINKYRAG